MTGSNAVSNAGPTPPADTPTPHTIGTDRPCARCGFNLFGQPIIREPHYQLIATRCPECGQLAALQEYPALGRWADRWARLLAALWIIILIGAMFAQFGPTLGLAISPIDEASRNMGNFIATEYQTHTTGQTEGPAQNTQFGINYLNTIERDWWYANRETLAERYAQRPNPARPEVFTMWATLALITFVFGAFWSTALLGAKRRWALLVASIPPTVAIAMTAVVISAPTFDRTVLTAQDAASSVLMARLLPLTAAIILVPLALGIFLGRRLARVLVRLALPPRMRSALAILWTRDGLPPPRSA
ncbi:MAG: hypothetical protein AAGA55_08425 [Planctomycetota bacterium]